MKVSELIKRLKAMPADTTVVVNMGKNELANGVRVHSVLRVAALGYTGPFGAYREDYFPHLPIEEDETRVNVVNITG